MQEGKHVILCIDDDPDIRDSLRIVLEANGSPGWQALKKATGVDIAEKIVEHFTT